MKVIATPDPSPFAVWHPLNGQVQSDEKHQVRCDTCSRYLKTTKQRTRHCKKFHPETHFFCDFCVDLTFYVLDDLVQHCKENHVICYICDTYFRNDDILTQHNEIHHQSIQPPPQPAPTPQEAPTAEAEEETTGEVPSTSQQSGHTCGICGAHFSTVDSFRAHLSTHKEIKCTFCPRQFYNIVEFNGHIRSDHPSQTEDASCIIAGCHRNFLSWKDMWLHVRAYHHREMPFRCSLDDCFLCFASIEALIRHGDCHGKESWKSEARRYCCSRCNEVFDMYIQVKVHTQMHEENTYKCDECEWYFSSISELALHGRDCHDTRHISCRSCPFYCDTAEDLVKHVKQHHYFEFGARRAIGRPQRRVSKIGVLY